MNLAYLANIRLPTEKAHGLQIVQMAEAFAAQPDVSVTLYIARRRNRYTPELAAVGDIWAYYGVARSFAVRRVPCLDLLDRFGNRLAFALEMATYLIALTIMLAVPTRRANRIDVYYSRDPLTLLLLSVFVRREKLCYEAHQLSTSRWQTRCVRRVGTVVAVTAILADRLRERGAEHIIVAHDGFRTARFAQPIAQTDARKQLSFPLDSFIVGYVGRLHTMGMSKGVETLIDAIGGCMPERIALCLVGGPDDQAELLRKRWTDLGLSVDDFLYVGAVPANRVPLYLAALDVCAMPLPWTEHFAYFASSLKLFEYMAAGRPLVATSLPSTLEVVQDGRSALLTAPGDSEAMAAALLRLKGDPALRAQLAAQAQIDVQAYSWENRAARILATSHE